MTEETYYFCLGPCLLLVSFLIIVYNYMCIVLCLSSKNKARGFTDHTCPAVQPLTVKKLLFRICVAYQERVINVDKVNYKKFKYSSTHFSLVSAETCYQG